MKSVKEFAKEFRDYYLSLGDIGRGELFKELLKVIWFELDRSTIRTWLEEGAGPQIFEFLTYLSGMFSVPYEEILDDINKRDKKEPK